MYNFDRHFLDQHNYIFSLWDLCPVVEKNSYKITRVTQVTLKPTTVKTTFTVFVAQIEIKQLRLPWQSHFVQIISRVELN